MANKCNKCGKEEDYCKSGYCKSCYEENSNSDVMQSFDEKHREMGGKMIINR